MAISDNLRNSLLTAGLGILGANRPGATAGQAIGQGGLMGLQAYNQGAAREQEALKEQQKQEAIQQASSGLSPELQQLAQVYPEMAANILAKQNIASYEENLLRSRPVEKPSLGERYQNLPGVGLIDLAGQNGPEVAIQGQEGPDTVINNIPGMMESEFSKQTAKSGADAIQTLQTGINSRAQQSQLLDQILTVADDAPSGPLANIELFGKNLGQSLGMDVEGLEQGEVLRGAANQLALLVRGNPEGGLPGAASDRDVKFLLNSGPQLAQSVQGRKALAKITKESLEYKNRVARAEQGFRQKNLGSVVGFNADQVKKPDIAGIIEQARKEVAKNKPIMAPAEMSDDDLLKALQ